MNTLTLVQSILIGGTATALATQLLKSDYLSFIPAEQYPRTTAFLVSVLASVISVAQSGFNTANMRDWTDWLSLIAGTLLVSSVTYNRILKGATLPDIPKVS